MYAVKSIRKKLPQVKIVFDVYEDFPGLYYDLFAINANRIHGGCVSIFVKMLLKKYVTISDFVITATPTIAKFFENYGKEISVICNYAIITTDKMNIEIGKEHQKQICYCVYLSKARGISMLLANSDKIHANIHLAGEITPEYKD